MYSVFLVFLAIIIGLFSPASAYIDFNTGSLIWQGLLALLIGGSYLLRTKIAEFLKHFRKP
jgi:hypothetical protein